MAGAEGTEVGFSEQGRGPGDDGVVEFEGGCSCCGGGSSYGRLRMEGSILDGWLVH